MAQPHRTLHSQASYKIFVYLRGIGIKCSLLELDLKNCTSPKDKNFRIVMLSQPSPTKSFLSGIILGFPNSCPRCLSLETTLHIIAIAHGLKNFGCLLLKLDLLNFSLWIFKHGQGLTSLNTNSLTPPQSRGFLFLHKAFGNYGLLKIREFLLLLRILLTIFSTKH